MNVCESDSKTCETCAISLECCAYLTIAISVSRRKALITSICGASAADPPQTPLLPSLLPNSGRLSPLPPALPALPLSPIGGMRTVPYLLWMTQAFPPTPRERRASPPMQREGRVSPPTRREGHASPPPLVMRAWTQRDP